MRTWITLTLVAAALAGAPALAADPNPSNSEIAAQLRAISDDLRALHAEMRDVRRDIGDIGVRGLDTATRLQEMQQRVDTLQAILYRSDNSGRRAFSFTPPAMPQASDTTPLPQAPPTGTIILRNFSTVTGTFYINGQPYSVAPGQSVEVRNVPLGTFTYEIAADGYGVIRPATTRVLTAGSPYYLNINP
jgi:hypothetical protein